MIRKNQQLEKFSNALVESRAFKFLRIDSAKVRVECNIIDQWATYMAKTDYDIMKTRIEEQTSLISYYKNRGDDYLNKILNIEKENVEILEERRKFEQDYNKLNEDFLKKQNETEEIVKGNLTVF